GRPYWRLLLAQVVPLAIGPVLPRSLQYAPAEFPVFLTKDCKNEICAKKWDAGTRADLAVAPSRRGQLRSVELLFRVIAAGYFANFPELYVSHPYTHRPLIEFCLRTPFSQFVRHGEFRSIMRRALKDILPPKILQRRTKSSMDEAILRAIQRDWHDIGDLRSWEVCKRGYVDVVPFQKVLTKLRTGIQDQLCSVLNTLAVEQWLRSVETFIRNKPLMHPGQEHGSALHALGGAAHAKHVS
ncbi:MAG TPA: asparagine synthase-related protein, partial [Candidatus Angelobacter sp.]|nr:asparagine synthase-related protein [Candidatus Angelobacter sp.]